MHTPRLTIAVPFLALFSHLSIFGMISATQLGHSDIRQHIYKHLPKEDQDDFRLVCKGWACKRDNWKFMPDSIEREYDNIIKKRKTVKIFDKNIILFSRTYENDLDAIQWILHTQPCDGKITVKTSKPLSSSCTLYAYMLAIHNNKPDIARLLIEAHKKDKNQYWKTCFKTISVPKNIEQCLYPSHDRDFSFIPYIIAVFLYNADNLRQLYPQTTVTDMGQKTLLVLAIQHNALNCFEVLLENETVKKLIRKERLNFFNCALLNNAKEIAQKLIENKLYNINDLVYNNTTILDRYYCDDKLKNRKYVHVLLDELGAKTLQDLEINAINRYCPYCYIQ
jgi:hypothetical protein